MGRLTNPEDDVWFGIEDPRKRKQVQDRLAQRARRKRLAESKQPPSTTDGLKTPLCDSGSTLDDVESQVPKALEPATSEALEPAQSTSHSNLCHLASVKAGATTSVYGALYTNGAMMGIPCSIVMVNKTPKFGDELPEPLRPTKLQMTVDHPRWIDRFPFPKMRDNLITLMNIIDQEEFFADLFCLNSFELEPGAAPWDPETWKIGDEFSKKWGYLFY